MHYKLSIVMSYVLFVFLFVFVPISESTSAKKNNATIAVVNGVGLSKAFFDFEMDMIEKGYTEQGAVMPEAQRVEYEKRVLDNMIAAELFFQEAKKQNVVVDQATVDQELSNIKSGFEKTNEYKKTLEKLKIDEAGLAKRTQQILITNKFVDSVKEKIQKSVTVSDKDCKEYYSAKPDIFKRPEQVRASHILLKIKSETDDSERKKIRSKLEKIRTELLNGGDFGALAKKHSECPSKNKGGDLYFFERGMMVKAFENVAFSMKIGDISDIVETQFGLHIIKVTDKRPAGLEPFEEAKEKIMVFLKDDKADKKLHEYLDGLKSKAKIEK